MYVHAALTRSRGEQANARPSWSLLQATYDEFIMVTEEVPLPEGAPEVNADDPVALLAAGRGQLVGQGCMRVCVATLWSAWLTFKRGLARHWNRNYR